jgi:hypothetical protein
MREIPASGGGQRARRVLGAAVAAAIGLLAAAYSIAVVKFSSDEGASADRPDGRRGPVPQESVRTLPFASPALSAPRTADHFGDPPPPGVVLVRRAALRGRSSIR